MSLLDPRVFAAIILALVLTGSGAYFYGRSDGRKIERASAQVEIAKWETNAQAAHELYLKARDEKQVEYRTITKRIEVAKNETTTDSRCNTGDDWMRLYRDNAAIANTGRLPADSGSAGGTDAR